MRKMRGEDEEEEERGGRGGGGGGGGGGGRCGKIIFLFLTVNLFNIFAALIFTFCEQFLIMLKY